MEYFWTVMIIGFLIGISMLPLTIVICIKKQKEVAEKSKLQPPKGLQFHEDAMNSDFDNDLKKSNSINKDLEFDSDQSESRKENLEFDSDQSESRNKNLESETDQFHPAQKRYEENQIKIEMFELNARKLTIDLKNVGNTLSEIQC